MLKPQSKVVTTLVAISFALAASSAVAKPSGHGYARDFSGHIKGSKCGAIFTNHPLIDGTEFRVENTFTANGSYYASRYHNRSPEMSAGNLYHECDATIVAYNPMLNGTILRITNPLTGISQIVVVQDKGGPKVDTRPDLSRGLLETLGGGRSAEEIGLLKGLTYEVLVPIE